MSIWIGEFVKLPACSSLKFSLCGLSTYHFRYSEKETRDYRTWSSTAGFHFNWFQRSIRVVPSRFYGKLVKWICIYRGAESSFRPSINGETEGRAKVLLTRAWTRFVASISTVVDNVADFVEGDAVSIGALKLALPAGKHRRRRENAGANEPMHVWNIVKSDSFQYEEENKFVRDTKFFMRLENFQRFTEIHRCCNCQDYSKRILFILYTFIIIHVLQFNRNN